MPSYFKWWQVFAWLPGGGRTSIRWWAADALRVKRLHEAEAGIHDITGRARGTYSTQPGSNDAE